MSDKLISSTFLFRFCVPCLRCDTSWTAKGTQLGSEYSVPSFHAELEDGPRFSDLRMAWNDEGLTFHLRVSGKKQAAWCRESRLEDSDGLSLWIDTRDTQSIHRAGRFCHRFVFLPQGAGPRLDKPVAAFVPIPRARENPKPVSAGALKVYSEKRVDGYVLWAFIPGKAMTGYEPAEHPRLGFSYVIADRELGWQTFSLGAEYPFTSDPSLWGSLELI